MRHAVIDVGSNSVLLLVAERQNHQWIPIYESSSVTALGEGTKTTGLLGETGMAKTLAALAEMFAKARELGVTSMIAAATMAARIATNTPDFLARADAQNTPVTVLSGEDEAELGFRAVATDPAFADASRITIIDPGGQSTEIVTADREGDDWKVLFRRSYPVGSLGLKSQMLSDESPDSFALFQASLYIDDLIGLCYRPGACGTAVVLGATGTNLISIREALPTWQPDRVHGQCLDSEEVSRAVGWMMPMSNVDRAKIIGMEPGREATLPGGALILERFLHALRISSCLVSIRGWRHALLESDPTDL